VRVVLAALLAGSLIPQPSSLSLVCLYDTTVGVSQKPSPLADTRQLERFLGLVASNLKDGDRLRVGLVARRLHTSRMFEPSQAADLFSKVTQGVTVPDGERIGPAPLWDSLYEAVESVANEGGRRAVIVMTTGESFGGSRTADEVASRAQAVSVSISPIFAAWPDGDAAIKRFQDSANQLSMNPSDTLKMIAIKTGGWYQAPKDGVSGDLKRRVKEVFTALRR
jgi:hypothetical protein